MKYLFKFLLFLYNRNFIWEEYTYDDFINIEIKDKKSNFNISDFYPYK